jgi:hypothetical protein
MAETKLIKSRPRVSLAAQVEQYAERTGRSVSSAAAFLMAEGLRSLGQPPAGPPVLVTQLPGQLGIGDDVEHHR